MHFPSFVDALYKVYRISKKSGRAVRGSRFPFRFWQNWETKKSVQWLSQEVADPSDWSLLEFAFHLKATQDLGELSEVGRSARRLFWFQKI